jgi:hypothetical protein
MYTLPRGVAALVDDKAAQCAVIAELPICDEMGIAVCQLGDVHWGITIPGTESPATYWYTEAGLRSCLLTEAGPTLLQKRFIVSAVKSFFVSVSPADTILRI